MSLAAGLNESVDEAPGSRAAEIEPRARGERALAGPQE